MDLKIKKRIRILLDQLNNISMRGDKLKLKEVFKELEGYYDTHREEFFSTYRDICDEVDKLISLKERFNNEKNRKH